MTFARTASVLMFENKTRKELNPFDSHDGKQTFPIDEVEYELDFGPCFSPETHSR